MYYGTYHKCEMCFCKRIPSITINVSKLCLEKLHKRCFTFNKDIHLHTRYDISIKQFFKIKCELEKHKIPIIFYNSKTSNRVYGIAIHLNMEAMVPYVYIMDLKIVTFL